MVKRVKFVLILILALLFITSCQILKPPGVVHRDNEPDVFFVESEDSEMLTAIQEAQETFDEFRDYYHSERSDLVYFSVKARFLIDGDPSSGEHIWLYDIDLSDNQVRGKIGNEPLDAVYLSIDEEVIIGMDDISDWMVVDEDGRVYGGYTVRVLRNRMTEEERLQFDEETGFIFEYE